MNLLLTGGTGSLGRALTKYFLSTTQFNKICIYSRDEHKQESMAREFNNDSRLRFFIGDVRDKERLRMALCSEIDAVIHAAALKIVPALEYNPGEAIKTNVLGAMNLIESSIYGPRKVIAISTDKAVKPINLYGATKLCAEKLFVAANHMYGEHGPKFSVVRYGNVANSNGSVIPKFYQQLREGKPLTITDDNMTRFWITLEEAVQLVVKSLGIMQGGEIFVPSMPSFKVKDLVYAMGEERWSLTGIRPGEKLHEEIITKEELEKTSWDMFNHLYVIRPSWDETKNLPSVKLLEGDCVSSNNPVVERLTTEMISTKLMQLGVF